MSHWHESHGQYWMFQCCWDGWLSLGIHVDWRSRVHAIKGIRFGPYIDLHLGPCILSLGYQPYWSSDWDMLKGRGGYRIDLDNQLPR